MTELLQTIRNDYITKLKVIVEKMLTFPDYTEFKNIGYVSSYGHCGKHISMHGNMSFIDLMTRMSYSKHYWGCDDEYYGITISKNGALCLLLSTIDTDFLVGINDVSTKTIIEIYNKLKNYEVNSNCLEKRC